MTSRIVIILFATTMIGGCAGSGLGGLSVDSPYGRGTANRIDSNREASPSRLYGWDSSNRQLGSSAFTGR